MKKSKSEIIKRYILFIISLFFSGLGIAFTKCGELGVSPISSMANVVSFKFTFLSFGMWLTITNLLLLVGQIVLLRKNFNLIQLMQIPLSFVFGYFTDLGMLLARPFPNEHYWQKIILVLVGIVILGFGITLGVIADVVLNSGEGFVKALADVTKKDFSTVKVIFDVTWVCISIGLSFIFFGKLVGAREGTVLSAILVGFVVKFFKPKLTKPLNKILVGKKK